MKQMRISHSFAASVEAPMKGTKLAKLIAWALGPALSLTIPESFLLRADEVIE
jgi:hypothetical protein